MKAHAFLGKDELGPPETQQTRNNPLARVLYYLRHPRLNPPRQHLKLPLECYGQPFYRGWREVSEDKV